MLTWNKIEETEILSIHYAHFGDEYVARITYYPGKCIHEAEAYITLAATCTQARNRTLDEIKATVEQAFNHMYNTLATLRKDPAHVLSCQRAE
jgi:hypothetical protein